MDDSAFKRDGHFNRTYSCSSQRDVCYSCGTCGYELNLSSLNRNTASIGSKYGKSIKRGIISFFSIDLSRFTQVDEIHCVPHFDKHSWGLLRRRTKLLCRKCGNHIGNAYNGYTSSFPLVTDGAESSPSSKVVSHTKYDIRIRALQPYLLKNLESPCLLELPGKNSTSYTAKSGDRVVRSSLIYADGLACFCAFPNENVTNSRVKEL